MIRLRAAAVSVGPPDSTAPGSSAAQLVSCYWCDAAAGTGRLTPAGRSVCAMVHMRTKLAFVGNGADAFAALPPKRRAKVNDHAYTTFEAWEAPNPDLVARLRSMG